MRSWWFRLLQFAVPYWRTLLGIGTLMLVFAGLNALKPWPVKMLVDRVAAPEETTRLTHLVESLPGGESTAGFAGWLAAATIILFAAAWCVQSLHAYIQSGVAARISYAVGGQLFERLQRLSLRFHHRRPTGDLVRRVTTDSRCVRDLVINVCLPAQAAITTLTAMAIVMIQLDAPLAFVSFLAVPGFLIAQKRYYPHIQQRLLDQQNREGGMTSEAEQTLSALPMVQAFRIEAQQVDRFQVAASDTLQAYLGSLREQLKLRTWVGGAAALGRASVMLVGGYRVLEGHLTPGDLVVFLAYVGMLYGPVETLANLTVSTAAAHANAQRVFEVLDSDHDEVHEPTQPQGPDDVSPWRGEVAFRDVTFAYDVGSPVLQGVNLTASPGEMVAIIGPTGAGKSTLISLLLRFFDPSEGRILIDGVDIKQISLATLRNMVSILPQDLFLLPVSIAENIAYGRPQASEEEIVAAAKAANADEFIRRLPFGYDTVLGERGATLSGGEQQRIAIARAFLKAAPILVLDEPTSALDAHSEAAVVDALQHVMKGRTCFVIAHRLSTIRNADRIAVLDQGHIEETGTHDELVRAGGAYSAYCDTRFTAGECETAC